MLALVIASIIADSAHDAWTEWRRALWGDLVMRVREKVRLTLRARRTV
jgi:hypothetical protein